MVAIATRRRGLVLIGAEEKQIGLPAPGEREERSRRSRGQGSNRASPVHGGSLYQRMHLDGLSRACVAPDQIGTSGFSRVGPQLRGGLRLQ